MYATRCPHCGAPTPVSLAEPARLHCRACGYDGAPPPQVASALVDAASLVQRRNARERQLSDVQRGLLRSGARTSIVYLAIGLLGMTPCTCCFVAYVAPEQRDVTTWACSLAPIVFLAVATALGFLAIRRARRRLGEACAALPPAGPGEPAGCHVCGGPVETVSGEPFARCGFCRADNLVDPTLLARWHVARAEIVDGFGAAALRESRSARTVTRRAFSTVIMLTVLGPLVGVCLGAGLAVILDRFEMEPIDERYAIVETARGRCIAVVDEHDGRAYLSFSYALQNAGVEDGDPRPAAAVPTFDWRGLRGLRVHAPNHGYLGPDDAVWEIVRAYGMPGRTENHVILRGSAKPGEQRLTPHALCLAEGTAPPSTPIPLAYQE